MKKRTIVLFASGMVLLGVGIGSSLAWLQDSTKKVTNTFTTSNIEITLDEAPLNEDGMTLNEEESRVKQNENYKMVPGMVLEKDPTVTVKANSEDCWVFIKVEKSEDFDEYISYRIDPNNWMQLTDESGNAIEGVYCTLGPVTDITENRQIKILGYEDSESVFQPNEILVRDGVTKEMMNAIDNGTATKPTLTFTAYASQYWKSNNEAFEPYEAWTYLESDLASSFSAQKQTE